MRRTHIAVFAAAGALLLLAGCSRQPEAPKEIPEKKEAVKAPEAKKEEVPATYKVRLTTSKGPVVIEVHKDWAPRGAERFYALVKDGYFDGARFFRIVPRFIVQFGLAADPAKTRKWDTPIPDDPVLQTNRAGSVTFATAGPNTRTAQVFINLGSNQSLDGQGFAPFGQVTEGMSAVQQLYAGYGERPDQGAIRERGNTYLQSEFPKLDYIKKAEILSE